MTQNKIWKFLAIVCIIAGMVELNAGKYIIGGIVAVAGAGILFSLPRGNSNDASLYDKMIKAPDLTIEELYDYFKDMDTPFGKCWMGGHKKLGDNVIVFGPSRYKDYIIIAKNKDRIVLKSGTAIENLNCDDERLSEVLDLDAIEVTPKSYSESASYKIISTLVVEDLYKLINGYINDKQSAPEKIDMFNLFHYDSSDNIVRDMDDNQYATCETYFKPSARVTIYDMDGDVLSEVIANGDTTHGKVPKEGFKLLMSGDEYGTIYRKGQNGADTFTVETPDGTFTTRAFPAVRRANVSCNYAISLDGVRKALVAGNARISFSANELSTNDMILSFDDDYLLFYIAIQETIMASSSFLK